MRVKERVPGRPRRMVRAVVLGVAVVAVLIVTGVWVWQLRTSSAAPPFGEPEARRVEERLASGDPAQVSSVVALPVGAEIDPAFVAQLAAMRPDINPSTFTLQDATTATVMARGGSRTWVLVLRQGGGAGWQLISTVPLP